jgi:uracil-DNA glycosylase
MNPEHIPRLLAALAAGPNSPTVSNPYSSPERLRNLGAYLGALCDSSYSGHLLVGEAPGYKGGAVTGIPFTSQDVLATSRHPFVAALRPSLTIPGRSAEATASVVWGHLEECDAVPAMWNVFPFHPHKANMPRSNRKPNRAEVEEGKQFLPLILDILRPDTVIAVGGTAAGAFSRLFPTTDVVYVRHPSYGGKADFLSGVQAAGVASRSGRGSDEPRPRTESPPGR